MWNSLIAALSFAIKQVIFVIRLEIEERGIKRKIKKKRQTEFNILGSHKTVTLHVKSINMIKE